MPLVSAVIHDRDLGTPPEIMKRFRETGYYDWDAYEAFLRTREGAVDSVAQIARSAPVCVLCYEADAERCHRRFVAKKIAGRAEAKVEHLR